MSEEREDEGKSDESERESEVEVEERKNGRKEETRASFLRPEDPPSFQRFACVKNGMRMKGRGKRGKRREKGSKRGWVCHHYLILYAGLAPSRSFWHLLH